jgi:8-oxo-dGTP pyrophosphatase MutT (NUDIX family)
MPKKKADQQYAALPYAIRNGGLQVMLITSRETKRWVIPKGWPEKKLAPHQVAERECFEEAGLLGVAETRALGTFEYLKRLGTAQRRVTVTVFPFQVAQELELWPEKKERRRKWMTPAQAAMRVTEAGLIDILLDLAGLLDDTGQATS